MRKVFISSVAILMLTVSANAGGRDSYQPPKPTNPSTTINNSAKASAQARANAAAIAKGGSASVKNSGNSYNKNSNKQSQSQSQEANSYSGGNTLNNVNNYKTAAASAYAPSGMTTAPCQKYASAGGQGLNFGFSFGFNTDSKKCWDLVRAADYKALYGPAVVRAYYEANDPVLAGIVAKMGTGVAKAKPRKAAKKQCACR